MQRSEPGATLAKASRLVDERTGIIRMLFENPADPDGPELFGYGSLLADTERYGLPDTGSINGSTSIVRERAMAGAIGEAVERYSARYVPEEHLVEAPLAELEGAAIDPRSLVLYSDRHYESEDFPYARFHDRMSLAWTRGCSLTRGSELYVPAFATYMPFFPADAEPPLIEQTTNGLACGNTIAEAVLSGINEVVERHAVMSMWLQQRSAPLIDCTAGITDPVLAATRGRFRRATYDMFMVDVTADVDYPAVVAAAIDRSGRGPAATFASAASLSPQGAALGALEELAQCVPWVRGLVEDHVLWPAAAEHLPLVEFIVGSRETRSLADMPDASSGDVLADIRTSVAKLAESGYEVVIVDVTSPDIEEIGLKVARVLVPEMQPLYFGRGLERISPRVCPPGSDPAATLPGTLTPHPFP
jgi:ribosomal protein S12 methylthiotransferase accessory factor